MHATQVIALDAPTTLLDVPAGHDTHDEAPADLEYVPAEQGIQSLALSPPISARKVPATQKLSQKVAPFDDVHEPDGQKRHVDREPTGLYDPAKQRIEAADLSGQ